MTLTDQRLIKKVISSIFILLERCQILRRCWVQLFKRRIQWVYFSRSSLSIQWILCGRCRG